MKSEYEEDKEDKVWVYSVQCTECSVQYTLKLRCALSMCVHLRFCFVIFRITFVAIMKDSYMTFKTCSVLKHCSVFLQSLIKCFHINPMHRWHHLLNLNASWICYFKLWQTTFAAFMNESNMHTKLITETKYFTTNIACSLRMLV